MATDDGQTRTRTRIAWVITGCWASCFPLAAAIKDFPITWAQVPMASVAAYYFAAPVLRARNGRMADDD